MTESKTCLCWARFDRGRRMTRRTRVPVPRNTRRCSWRVCTCPYPGPSRCPGADRDIPRRSVRRSRRPP